MVTPAALAERSATLGAYTRHPFSARFGDMDSATFQQLRASMAATDYETSERQPEVSLFEGQVLDGWHRYLCCLDLGIPPAFTTFAGSRDDAWAFVRRENRYRRQLSQAQCAAIYISDLDPDDDDLTVAEHAARAGVSKRLYEQVRTGIHAGYAEDLMAGKLTAEQAYALARQADPTPATRMSRTARLRREIDRARRMVAEKEEENAHLHHRVMVLSARLNAATDGNAPLLVDEYELNAVKAHSARVERHNAILAEANSRLRDHVAAISDLVAMSDEPITEQDLTALARQYRPAEIQMEAFTE